MAAGKNQLLRLAGSHVEERDNTEEVHKGGKTAMLHVKKEIK